MAIDSHVHFWKYDKNRYSWIDNNMKMLQKDHLPEHIAQTFNRNGVNGCVAVQAAATEFETLFLVELAKTHPIIRGVVGWVDLQNERVEERLQDFSQFPVIKGYRHIVQSEPDDFLYNEAFRRGLRALQPYNYTYDILIFPQQLKAAIDLVQDFPDQMFVLDHCGKPGIRREQKDEWKHDIQHLAANPNVYCKLSGLLTEAKWKDWSAADFYPYLEVVFDSFGTDRLMFGSDWPVMLLSGIYVQWKSLLEKYMEHLMEDVKENVLGLNAERFYGLA
jgi:L-fuconolactonase